MEAYKLTYEETDFEGKTRTFKATAYNQDEIESSKKYHEERGAKLINIEDISIN